MNYAPPKVRMIGEVRALTGDEIATMFDTPAVKQPVRHLRLSHHRIARLIAAGLRTQEIRERTGYSYSRLEVLRASPAFNELVEHYKSIVDASFVRAQDAYMDAATSNMLMAEGQIAERLEAAEDGEPIPLKDLIAISRDGADRFGYGKKSMVFNPGADFAAVLERAVERTKRAQTPAVTLEIEADA